MASSKLNALEADARPLPHEIASSEIAVPEYTAWRSSLERFRDRAACREDATLIIEAHNKSLERRHEEARERWELEERRRQEAAARAEQRRLEASEYSAWRADLVLARRAEERARAAEHIQWRSHLTKLQRGSDVEGVNPLPSSPRNAVAAECASWQRPGIFDVPRNGHHLEEATGSVEETDRQLLDEEESWNAMVRRNKEAIRAEREQSKAQAARRATEEQRDRILRAHPILA